MAENQTIIDAETLEPVEPLDKNGQRRGGRRKGSGRKPLDLDARFVAAREGLTPLAARTILATVVNEREVWRKIFSSDDERVLLAAMTFLLQMRDGRPAQQINVSSVGIHFSADEIARTKAIAREFIKDNRHLLEATTGLSHTPSMANGEPNAAGEQGVEKGG